MTELLTLQFILIGTKGDFPVYISMPQGIIKYQGPTLAPQLYENGYQRLKWMSKEHETHLTQLTSKLGWTFTYKTVQHWVALAAILAWFAVTVIILNFTVSACEARRAPTVETPRALLKKDNENEKSKGAASLQIPPSFSTLFLNGIKKKNKKTKTHPYLARCPILALTIATIDI